jgi:hypothetical protein
MRCPHGDGELNFDVALSLLTTTTRLNLIAHCGPAKSLSILEDIYPYPPAFSSSPSIGQRN